MVASLQPFAMPSLKKVESTLQSNTPSLIRGMAEIKKLPSILIDRIAAGEVIERPASVVKELVENAIDAGATHIKVETISGGMESMLIQDDGIGISFDQLPLSLERHATSKINDLSDLDHILSYGFRGEALAAISSVSYLQINSTAKDTQSGGIVTARGGKIESHQIEAPTIGTTIQVNELFYSTPARLKFMKSQRSEDNAIHKELQKLAFANPQIHFSYKRDTKLIFDLPKDNDLLSRISAVYGSSFAEHLLFIQEDKGSISVAGFIGDDKSYRTSNDRQFSTVNGRPVEIKNLPFFVKKAYSELIPDGGKPIFFLELTVDSSRVDVNVHPAKREVRLTDESLLHNLILTACQRALFPDQPLPFLRHSNRSFTEPLTIQPSQPSSTNTSDLLYPTEQLLAGSGMLAETAAYTISSTPKSETNQAPLSSGFDSKPFLPIRHFGVIFGTYILAEGNDEFYLIDQHTAHERINFEKKKKQLEERKLNRQILLHPIALHYETSEIEHIIDQSAQLVDAGFVVEQIGPNQLVLREAPDFIDPGEETEMVSHAIDRLIHGEDIIRVYDEYAAMKACKASIKKNDIISPAVLSDILKQLSQCQQPSRCPHGRPTILRFTKSEIDRLFFRTGFNKTIDAKDS